MSAADGEPGAMSIECPHCDACVVAEPHGYYVRYIEPREGLPARWTLLACREKGHPLLVVQEDFGRGIFEDDKPYRMYPPQERRLNDLIPRKLRNAHEEARRCFRSKAYKATVVMCGITLEGACELQGAEKKFTLEKKLEDMKNNGKIDNKLWEWAESLRHVRNSSAHFNDEEVTRQDADDSIAFSEALLDYLYVLSARFEAMKQRRPGRKQANSQQGLPKPGTSPTV